MVRPRKDRAVKINKSTVDRLLPRSGAYFVWDEALRGFGIRVSPSGSKHYWVRFRIGRGRSAKQRKRSIGLHGSPWSPDQARTEALQIISVAARGEDRAGEGGRSSDSVNHVCDRFLRDHVDAKRKLTTQSNYRSIINLHIRPALGTTRTGEVSFQDVAQLHASMVDRPYQANRTLAVLSKMFSLAERWGCRPQGSNPCRGVDRFNEKRRERFLDGAEIKRLFHTFSEIERERGYWPPIGILRLLALTGARRAEIEQLRWAEVDLERGLIFKADSKTGQRAIPLNSVAISVLADLPRVAGGTFVFPARSGGRHFQGLTKAWKEIRQKAVMEDVRVHDLRHTFASLSVAAGVSLPILGKALGHTSPQTTQRYAHLSDDPVRAAVERTGRAISEAAGAC
jgi:integrase